jgi:predicted TIM-barrel fold metal-dependent hydrolase
MPDEQVSLFDTHTHTQPSPDEAKGFLGQFGMPEHSPGRGTVHDLLATMDDTGLSRSLIIPWMPAQDHVWKRTRDGADRDQAVHDVLGEWRSLNRWATDQVARQPDRLVCLVGVDPVLMTVEQVQDEVRGQIAAGAAGIKVAPMFLGVHPDDERMEVVWRLARELDVPVLSESGTTTRRGEPAWGHPKHFHAVCAAYPEVRIQLAHLSLGAEEALMALTAEHRNVWADTSLRLGGYPGDDFTPAGLADTIRRIGVDRVLYGTNYPMVDARAYATAFRALPLDADELRAVATENALALYPLAARPPAPAAGTAA